MLIYRHDLSFDLYFYHRIARSKLIKVQMTLFFRELFFASKGRM